MRQAEQRIASLAAVLGLPPSTAGAAAAAAVRDPAAEVQQLEQPAAAAAAAAAAVGVAGAGPGSESPAVGESGAAVTQEAVMADHSASGATSMEREQQAQQAQQAPELAQEQQAQQVAAVDVVAASGAGSEVDPHAARRPSRINSAASDGSDRPGLKRDRSKVYAPIAKRRERDAPRVLKTTPVPQPQPASSGSSMQASCACGACQLGCMHASICACHAINCCRTCSTASSAVRNTLRLSLPNSCGIFAGFPQRRRGRGGAGGRRVQWAAAHHHAAHQGGAAAVEGAAGGCWVLAC